MYAVFQLYLHLSDVYHTALCMLLKLLIVYVCAVHGHNIPLAED